MSLYVVDASVAVKWFVPEEYSDAASILLDSTHQLLAPDLMLPEFGNVVWKKLRMGELAEEEAREIVTTVRTFPIDLFESDRLLESAFELAVGLSRTVYDSMYLARVAEHIILVVLFNKRTTLGLVRLRVKKAVEGLDSILTQLFNKLEYKNEDLNEFDEEFADELNKEIDSLFSD